MKNRNKVGLTPSFYRNEEMRARQYFSANFSNTVYGKYNASELANAYFELGQYQEAEDEFFFRSVTPFQVRGDSYRP
jgi:hypothetical protein